MRRETDRLVLRPWEDRDRAPLAAIMGDPAGRRFYPRTMTPEETAADIAGAIEKARLNGFHMQAAELKADGALVGMIGIGRIPEGHPLRPHVLYRISSAAPR